jgi:hypothetical protein
MCECSYASMQPMALVLTHVFPLCMSDNGFIPLGNTSFTGCGYVITTSSSSSSSSSSSESLLCVSLTYPFWPLPSSPSPVLSPHSSPSCCRVSGAHGGVWAFVAGAGVGIPMVALPPHLPDDSDSVIQSRADERLAWTFSRSRSVTRDCAVSFVPSSPLLSEIIREPLYPFSVSISWQEIKGTYRCVCFPASVTLHCHDYTIKVPYPTYAT